MNNETISVELRNSINLYEKSLEALPQPDFKMMVILIVIIFLGASGFLVFSIMKNKKIITMFGMTTLVATASLGLMIYTNISSEEYKEAKKELENNELVLTNRIKGHMRETASKVVSVEEINYYAKGLPLRDKKCENVHQEKSYEELYVMILDLEDDFFKKICGEVIVRKTLNNNAKPYVSFKYLAPELRIGDFQQFNGVILYVPNNYTLVRKD